MYECKRHANPLFALGLCVDLLQNVSPFATIEFSKMVGSLAGQIKRNHYLFTFAGNEVVGYVGWALCEEGIARAWLYSGYQPIYEQGLEGDCVYIMAFYAKSAQASLYQSRYLQKIFRGKFKQGFWKRMYPSGRIKNCHFGK